MELSIAATNKVHDTIAICLIFPLIHYLFYPIIIVYLIYSYPLYTSLALCTYYTWIYYFKTHMNFGWSKNNLIGWGIIDYLPYYLRVHYIVEEQPDPSQQYLFAIGPHAIISLFRTMLLGNFFHRLFPGIKGRFAGASPMFWIPFIREIALFCGAIDASKASLTKVLSHGESVFLIPGGSQELFETNHDSTTRLVVKNRYGFVKLAIENKVPIIPVMVFGEKHSYRQIKIPSRIKKIFYRFKIPFTLFYGRWGTLLPFRNHPYGIVFGKPIAIDSDDIKTIHQRYVTEMERLFETFKGRFDYSKKEKLLFIDALN